jgi:hypothetical protein
VSALAAVDIALVAVDIALVAVFIACMAVDMVLVAVFIACMAVDIVLADDVALVAAAASWVAAVVTFMAATDTVRAAEAARAVPALAPRAVAARVAGVRAAVARRAVLRDDDPTARLAAPVRAALARGAVPRGAAIMRVAEVRAAVAVPRTWRPAADFVLAFAFCLLAAFLAALLRLAAVRVAVADLRRTAVRAMVCTGIDLPPYLSITERAIPRLAGKETSQLSSSRRGRRTAPGDRQRGGGIRSPGGPGRILPGGQCGNESPGMSIARPIAVDRRDGESGNHC